MALLAAPRSLRPNLLASSTPPPLCVPHLRVPPLFTHMCAGEKAFHNVLSSKHIVKFVVMDVELCAPPEERGEDDDESWGSKFALADVIVAREVDYGVNDDVLFCVSHLGNLLQVGDMVEGYDLTATVFDDAAGAFVSSFEMPDVVLVRKTKSGGADAGTVVGAGSGETSNDTKKSRRQKKKDANKATKESKGRGYRGVKKQSDFEVR